MQSANYTPVFPKSEIRDYVYFGVCVFLVTNWKIGLPKAKFNWAVAVLLETFALAGDVLNILNTVVWNHWTAVSVQNEVNYANNWCL